MSKARVAKWQAVYDGAVGVRFLCLPGLTFEPGVPVELTPEQAEIAKTLQGVTVTGPDGGDE